jgi:hypothetical protein
MNEQIIKNDVFLTFHNAIDFLEYVRNVRTTSKNPSLTTEGACAENNEKWCGTKTFEEAVQLAESGWKEGGDLIRSISNKIYAKIACSSRYEAVTWAEEGEELDVGTFLDGIPEHWGTSTFRKVKTSTGTSLRFYYNCSVSGSVSKKNILMRGSIACAIIAALERYGYRVELWAGDGSRNTYNTRPYNVYSYVKIKNAEDALDIDKIAFYLCHASFLRRLYFALIEIYRDGVERGYGTPCNLKNIDSDVKTPELATCYNISTDKAYRMVVEKLKEFGIEINK